MNRVLPFRRTTHGTPLCDFTQPNRSVNAGVAWRVDAAEPQCSRRVSAFQAFTITFAQHLYNVDRDCWQSQLSAILASLKFRDPQLRTSSVSTHLCC